MSFEFKKYVVSCQRLFNVRILSGFCITILSTSYKSDVLMIGVQKLFNYSTSLQQSVHTLNKRMNKFRLKINIKKMSYFFGCRFVSTVFVPKLNTLEFFVQGIIKAL